MTTIQSRSRKESTFEMSGFLFLKSSKNFVRIYVRSNIHLVFNSLIVYLTYCALFPNWSSEIFLEEGEGSRI